MTGTAQWSPIADQAVIDVPASHRRKIAIVGAGVIVQVAHLPAYRTGNLNVVGIFDLNYDRATEVAKEHGIETVYHSLAELLADKRVEVVDIAVAPQAQPDIIEAAIRAGKHLLCQKPFVPDLQRGRALIAQAEQAGVHLVVNQQMRYDEGIAAARAAVEAGWIGELTAMSFQVDIKTDWTAWDWIVTSERLEIAYHSIHYLDSIRSIMGDPTRVYCVGSKTPGQVPAGETRTMTTLTFDGDRSAILHVNHENNAGDYRAEFRIDGTEGTLKGTVGLLYDYPNGRPDTLELQSSVLPTDGWLPYPVTQRWIPDAFLGPMASLLRWIETGEQASTHAADNLGTLALVHALYVSMETGAAQDVTW